MSEKHDILVLEPGMQTTVQDLGRPGWTHIGVPRGGAADALSLRVGNRIVGNDDHLAALEMTLIGATLEFTRDLMIVLTGGHVEARMEPGNASCRPARYSPFHMHAAQRLVVGAIQRGVRTYLCVAGGIDVPVRLGSRAACVGGGFGGLDGRPLRKGDGLCVGAPRHTPVNILRAGLGQRVDEALFSRRTLRVVDGAHHDSFRAASVDAMLSSDFRVSWQSDRTGLRLEGRVGASSLGGRMPSEGMMHGALQVPENGEPIVLMVDHPTTGGYPVIACVAAVDFPVLGQLRAGDLIRFKRVDRAEARALFAAQEHSLDEDLPNP